MESSSSLNSNHRINVNDHRESGGWFHYLLKETSWIVVKYLWRNVFSIPVFVGITTASVQTVFTVRRISKYYNQQSTNIITKSPLHNQHVHNRGSNSGTHDNEDNNNNDDASINTGIVGNELKDPLGDGMMIKKTNTFSKIRKYCALLTGGITSAITGFVFGYWVSTYTLWGLRIFRLSRSIWRALASIKNYISPSNHANTVTTPSPASIKIPVNPPTVYK